MKKGSKVKITKEQSNRESWMITNKIYWGWIPKDGDFHMAMLKVGNIYEVLKSKGVTGPIPGLMEIKCDVTGRKTLVLKEDVEEVQE